MSDNITLPREVVKEAVEALEYAERHHGGDDCYAESATALRAHLAAPKQEPWMMGKDWLKMTLRMNRGDRVFTVERFLHLSEIKQSRFPLVQETADTAWQELNTAMKVDIT